MTGCWLWDGPASCVNSRGLLNILGRSQNAARWIYELCGHDIPAGMDLHHRCETPACVNPDHLEPMTRGEHSKRHQKGGYRKPIAIPAYVPLSVDLSQLIAKHALKSAHVQS